MSEAGGDRFAPLTGLPTVLLVEDVEYLRKLAATFLSRSTRVVAVGNGAEALEVAHRERPDVIVSDLRMPGMDGLELCRSLSRDPMLREVPLIMLVADETGVERGEAIRAGAADVLAKPLSRLSLVESVSRLLRESHGRSAPRVTLEAPVSLTAGGDWRSRERSAETETEVQAEHAVKRSQPPVEKGVVRNLSRGGLFIETTCELATGAEVDLQFRLPGSRDLLAPSAQVIWHRRAQPGRADCGEVPAGFGFRFLEIDRPAWQHVDDFVFERTTSRASSPVKSPGPNTLGAAQ